MAKVVKREVPKASFLRHPSEPNGESILATDVEYEISGLAGSALCLKGPKQARRTGCQRTDFRPTFGGAMHCFRLGKGQ